MAWPIKNPYGAPIAAGSVGTKQVAQNPAGKAASAPIEVYRHARNGKAPDAWLINQFAEAANQSILYRGKEVFSASGYVGLLGGEIPSSNGAGDRIRWRWAFHTGVYHSKLLVVMIMHPQDSGFTYNSRARIDIYSSATYGGSPVGTATFNHGANPGGTTIIGGLSYLKASQQYIEGLSPDTTYYGIAYDVDNGRMVSCSVAELQSMTEEADGYMAQNLTAETPILGVYRENLSDIIYNQWRRGAAQVFNFTIEEPGAIRQVSSSTPNNVINQAVATYGAQYPGYTLDMTGKARLSQSVTGVPIRFCAYVDVPAANTGVVTLRDSSGTAIVTLTQAGAYTGWVTGTGVLPASEAKYYITHHRSAGAGDITTYAVSCYEYE